MIAPPLSRALPRYVVCPLCHGPLQARAEATRCAACAREYGWERDILNLLEGEPFRDEPDPERSVSEELMDAYTTRQYTLPALARTLAPRPDPPVRVLSVGCGVGVDVDLINEAGYECVGIDCGSRILDWATRRRPDRLYVAHAGRLPFADGTFDLAFSGCMLAHIGVVGDSWKTTPAYWAERSQVCAEVVRVMRKGGHIILSGANRACPADLFHRDRGYLPRFHRPSEPFLLGFGDYRKLFVEQCGCVRVATLSSGGYWGFNRLTKSFPGRVCAALIAAHMRVISAAPLLCRSFLNPWLIVKVEK